MPDTDRELGFGLAEFPPNASHPHQKATGLEICYVLDGEVTVRFDGKPAVVYRAGQTFQLPALVAHQTTAGPAGAKVLASWVDAPAKQFNIAVPTGF